MRVADALSGRAMPLSVILVLLAGSPSEVNGRVIAAITVEMTDFHALRPRPVERFADDPMDVPSLSIWETNGPISEAAKASDDYAARALGPYLSAPGDKIARLPADRNEVIYRHRHIDTITTATKATAI